MNDLKIDFSDFMVVVRKFKSRIIYTSLFFGLAGAGYAVLKIPEYYVEASFKEKGKSFVETGKNLNLAMLLGGSAEKNENSAFSLMKSRKLLQRVIYQQGLQGQLKLQGAWNPFSNIRSNVLAEMAYFKSDFYPQIGESPPLSLQSLDYKGELPHSLVLHFDSENEYSLRDGRSNELEKGTLGHPFKGDGFSFILKQGSLHNLTGTQWNLTLQPLTSVLENTKNNLKIRTDPEDKSVLMLSYKTSDRKQAADFLNGLMASYVLYLKEEHERLAQEQLNYLHRRQQEIAADLKHIMEEHAEAVSSNTTSIEALSKLQETYTQRALVINLELKRLNKALGSNIVCYDPSVNETDSSVIHRVLADIRSCKEQAGAIQVAINAIESGPSNKESLVKGQASQKPLEFQGIDLSTANQLYLDYNQKLNEIESSILHYEFIISQIQDPHFEISTLSSVLNDAVSQNIIHQAVELDLKKLDQSNRSQKEIDRFKADLALQRKYLLFHVEQILELFKIKQKLLFDKITALQYLKMDLLDQRMAFLNQHLSDYIKGRMQNFQQEIATLEQQQKTIKTRMEDMPSQWASNKLIDLHLEMSSKMVEEITKLVETKNISSHMELTQSSPLDASVPPLLPINPHLILFTTLGMLCGGLISLASILTNGILKNTALSIPLLKQLNLQTLGPLSVFEEAHLFQIIGWLNAQAVSPPSCKTAFLFLNTGDDYSDSLAVQMAKQGSKVLLVSLEESSEKENSNEYQVHSKNGYDCLPVRISSKSECASLFSGPFLKYLEKLKLQYDWIFVAFPLSPCSEEAENLYGFCDCALMTLKDESLQQVIASLNKTQVNVRKLLAVVVK